MAAFMSWRHFLRRRFGIGGVFTATFWSAVFFYTVFRLDLDINNVASLYSKWKDPEI